LAVGSTVKGGISGLKQGSRFGIATIDPFLVSEKHQKICILIRLPVGLCQSASKSCRAEAIERDRGCFRSWDR
jgi:TFIIF-interacting CTD phosphatase-like protein